MEDQMARIKQNLKAPQNRQKTYAERNIVLKDFKVVKHVVLKVKKDKFAKIRKLPEVCNKILWSF
jgi:hypothetical protein